MYNQLLHEITRPIFIAFTLDFIIFTFLASLFLRRSNKQSFNSLEKSISETKTEANERENKNFRYLHANLLRLEERVVTLENKPKRKYIRKEKKDESL